jgi:hypothetical protein
MKIFATVWATGLSFIVDQAVNYNGVAYICTTAHTATSTFDSAKFTLLNPVTDDYYHPVRDSFYRENFFAVDVVYIGLPDSTGTITESSVLRLCNGGINVTVPDGFGIDRTYTAQGDFIGFSTITEEFDVKVGKFNISLSGLGSGMVDRFIDKDFEGSFVQVGKAFLDYDTLQVIENRTYIMFEGIVYNVSINESAITCNITVECSSLWADFDRKNGRMTNNNSNWVFQNGNTSDTCFSKASTVGKQEFKWGRA